MSTDGIATEPENSAQAVESRLIQKIENDLDLFLDRESYRIFANAQVRNFRQKIVLDGESVNDSSENNKAMPKAASLPGFENIETTSSQPREVKRKEKSRFRFEDKTQLIGVSVRLILDKQLEPGAKELANKTTQEIIQLTVGDKATLEVSELDLNPTRLSDSPWAWFIDYLSQRGASAIDLLYIALWFLALIGGLLAIRHFFKKRQLNESANSDDSSQSLSQENKLHDEQISLQLDELVSILNQSPLLTRIFLQSLKLKDKQSLYHSLNTPAMRSYFRKLLVLEHIDLKGKSSKDTEEFFKKILRELKRFICLNEEIESKPFGYIVQLTGSQIAHLVLNESDRVHAMITIAPYLNDIQMEELNKYLSVEEKAEIIQHIHSSGQSTSKTLLMSSQNTKLELDEKLRNLFNRIKQEAVVDVLDSDSLETLLLDSDNDCIDVIKILSKRYDKVPTAYEKYLVSFEDLLRIDLGIGKKVFQRISNEVLTTALADKKIDKRLSTMLGEMRSQLIESYKKRDDKVSEEEILNARNEILRTYRTIV